MGARWQKECVLFIEGVPFSTQSVAATLTRRREKAPVEPCGGPSRGTASTINNLENKRPTGALKRVHVSTNAPCGSLGRRGPPAWSPVSSLRRTHSLMAKH